MTPSRIAEIARAEAEKNPTLATYEAFLKYWLTEATHIFAAHGMSVVENNFYEQLLKGYTGVNLTDDEISTARAMLLASKDTST